MTLAFPWLLLLLPVALAAWRDRPRRAVPVTSLAAWRDVPASRKLRWQRRLRPLRVVAVALLVVASAGPQRERQVGEETREGVAIELLMDISSSMDQQLAGGSTARLTRLAAAKEVVEQFIRNRPNDLIGVVTFARYADTLSPLTFGHDALIEIVRQLTIQDRPNEDGTAYGDALTLACARLEQMKEWQTAATDRTAAIRSQVVVLLTDGENNCGLHLPEEAAGLAKKWGIRVYAISLTDSGPAAPAVTATELTAAEKLLQHLAGETGGNYWKIGNAPQLQAVYDEIDRLEKSKIKNATLYHTEISPLFSWFALPALVLLLVERILSATWLRVAEEDRG